MGIALDHRQRAMAEHVHKRVEITSFLHPPGCERVFKVMKTHVFQICAELGALEETAEGRVGLRGVNRRSIGTPDRRAKRTPLSCG